MVCDMPQRALDVLSVTRPMVQDHSPSLQETYVAVNLCAKMKGGKVRYFMLSRYEGHEALLDEIAKRANRPVEEVKQGLGGPKFVDA